MLLRRLGITAIALFSFQGCTSMTATYLGNPEEGVEVNGMPVVLERPRYLRVTVRAIDYQLILVRGTSNDTESSDDVESSDVEEPGNNQNEDAESETDTESSRFGDVVTSHVIEYETISVGEVYALDFKRPASGTSDLQIEFADGAQYPSKITANTEDTTIAQVRELLGTILEAAVDGALPTSGQLDGGRELSGSVQSVVVSSTIQSVYVYDLDQLGNANYRPTRLYPLTD